MLIRQEVITAKVEGTYGVDATPAATDAIKVENLNWSHESPSMINRNALKATLGTDQQVYGGTLGRISFDVELKGSGTAGTAPEWGVLMKGCACSETIVAVTSVTYAPRSTSIDSITIYYYQDGTLRKFLGARGEVSINAVARDKAMLHFEFVGHMAAPADVALVSGTFDTTVPPAILSGGFDIGGYSAVIRALTLNSGNILATPDDFNASDGFGEVRVVGRDVNGTFDPEAVLVATEPFESDWRAGTTFALTTGVIGSAGNQYQIAAPVVAYRNLGPSDRAGVRTYDIGFGAAESSGDDEWSLALT